MNDQARVLFFATLRDRTGVRETTIEFPTGANISDIKKLLLQKYPSLKPSMETLIVAMNHEFAFDDTLVSDGAEIALFPPVSGGNNQARVFPTVILMVRDEINIDSIVEQISSETTGAACVFSGIVRGETVRGNPHHTEELEYEAYNKMAELKMFQISDEIRSRWREIEGIAIIQRVGKLSPGIVSVVIACTSPHRDSGIF